jgi:orotate phosphoribosyltransferase
MAILRSHAAYLDAAINNPDTVLALARDKLQGVDYDTLIGTGLSGALVLPMLARGLGKEFAVVRKADNSHSGIKVEGSLGERWVFVDDLIASGATLAYARDQVCTHARKAGHTTAYVGAFLYHSGRYAAHQPDEPAADAPMTATEVLQRQSFACLSAMPQGELSDYKAPSFGKFIRDLPNYDDVNSNGVNHACNYS